MLAAVAWAKQGAPALNPTTMDETNELGDEPEIDEADEERKAARKTARKAAEESGKRSSARGGKRRASAEDEEEEAEEQDSDDSDDEPLPFVRQNLAFYKNNHDDPHLTKGLEADEEAESEIEDFTIQPTDLMLMGARSDEEMSNLEVYIYEPAQDNLYVHHDIPLPVFPLCLAWMGVPPADCKGPMGGGRNFVAVGTFQPFIEIWNLDVIDSLEPAAVLGLAGAEAAAAAFDTNAAAHEAATRGGDKGGKKKKKSKRPVIEPPPAEGHTDAVLCLAWNALQPNVLASGSADNTVRLWDLGGDLSSSAQCMRHHTDKVQALAWHPVDASVLLTAGFDRKVFALDVRAPEAVRHWALSADVESIAWNPHDANYFAASSEDGIVKYFDARVDKKPVFTLQAHDGACSSIDFNPEVAGLLATGGMDKKAKLWSVEGNRPSMVASREMGLGAIFDLRFSHECPALLAAGGSLGKLGVWNTLETQAMQALMPTAQAPLDDEGRVMGGAVAGMGVMGLDSEDEEGEEGEEGGEGEEPAYDDDRATAREPRGTEREVGSWTAEAGERKSEKKAVGKKAKGKGKVKGR